MFLLRKEHEAAFNLANYARFKRKAIAWVLQNEPDAVRHMDRAVLESRVSQWCDQARAWGFEVEADVMNFVYAMAIRAGDSEWMRIFPGVLYQFSASLPGPCERAKAFLAIARGCCGSAPVRATLSLRQNEKEPQ